MDIQEVISPAGIKAWLLHDATVPVITLTFAFRHSGAAYDPGGQMGLAHLVANTLDEGAGPLNAEEFHAALEDDSINLAYTAERDELRGELKTLSANRTRAAELLRLSLTIPRFDAKEVRRVAEQLIGDLQYQTMDPDWAAYRSANHTILAGHPYQQPSQGTSKSLRALQPAQLQDYARQHLTRDKLVIGVAGDITPADLGIWLDDIFAALPASAETTIPTLLPVTLQAAGKTFIVPRQLPQSKVLMVQPGIKRSDPAWYAANIMNYVFGGGGFNSRLMHEVREKRGLTYGVDSQISHYDYADLMIIGAATSNDKTAEAVEVIRAEAARLAAEGITAEELQNAKTYLTGVLPLSLTSTDKIAGFIMRIQLDHLPLSYPDDRTTALNAVTREAVAKVAQKLLQFDAVTTIVVGQPTGLGNTSNLPDPAQLVLGS